MPDPHVHAAHLALARASRGKPDPSELAARRRDLAEAKLAAYIARTVAAAPPLTPAQRDRLALLLRDGDSRVARAIAGAAT